MDDLKKLLAEMLDGTSFDLSTTEISYDGNSRGLPSRRVSASELREICSAKDDRVIGRSVRGYPSDASMVRLVVTLRRILVRFIDPESDRIGHAFFIEGGGYGMVTRESDGLFEMDLASPLRNFAGALLQAAAIDGIETITRRLEDWVRGDPIRVRLSTVLDGLILKAPVLPRDDTEVIPLPLTTAELPRLPFGMDRSPLDYLGRPKLTLHLAASPALFRPDGESREGIVRFASNGGIDFGLVCEALSLQANRCVDWCGHWHEFPDAAAFCLGGPSPWGPGSKKLNPLIWKSLVMHDHTGGATVTPFDNMRLQTLQCLDGEESGRTLDALRRADRKCRIAVDRWRRSKDQHIRLEDRYIELRIALESLYLKEFANEHSQEMRFRLSLFGAWHLGCDVESRQLIRRILRDAYDAASKVVHTGELPKKKRGLAKAQNLCRRGILKLLHEGPPADWRDLILGG